MPFDLERRRREDRPAPPAPPAAYAGGQAFGVVTTASPAQGKFIAVALRAVAGAEAEGTAATVADPGVTVLALNLRSSLASGAYVAVDRVPHRWVVAGAGPSAACDHGGVTLTLTSCGAPLAGNAVTIAAASGTLVAGTTAADGTIGVAWPLAAVPAGVTLDATHRDCRLVVAQRDVLSGTSGADPCVAWPWLDLCYADVTLSAVDLSTGATIPGARVLASGDGARGYGDILFDATDPQPRRLRRVYRVNVSYPDGHDPYLAGSTCTADYTTADSAAGPVPAGARLLVHAPGSSVGSDVADAEQGYVWECARWEPWCCSDATLAVSGLPVAGDSLWTREPGGAGTGDVIGTTSDPWGGGDCPCRAAADIAWDNQHFLPRTLHLTGSVAWYRLADGVGNLARESADVDATLAIDPTAWPGGFGSGPCSWASDPIAVSWPMGVWGCAGAFGAMPNTWNVTSVRFRAGQTSFGAYHGGVTVEFLADDRPGSAGCANPDAYFATGCKSGSFAAGVRAPASPDVPATCPGGPLFVGLQESVGYGYGCDSHVDWSWSCPEPYGTPAGCTLYGTLNLVGPV